MPYTIVTSDGVEIPNIPDNIPPGSPEMIAYVRSMRSTEAGQKLMGAIGMPTQAGLLQQAAAMPEQAVSQEQPEPETTAAGLAGATARGVVPTALGALGGAVVGGLAGIPAGPPGVAAGAATGAGVGAGLVGATDLVIGLANFATGKNYASPTTAVEGLLTEMGVPEPKSKAEKFWQAISAGATGGLGGAKAAASAAKILPAGGKAAQVAGSMATGPAAQTVMGATGGAGGEIAGQVAQEAQAGPRAELAARLLGGVAGSLAGAKGISMTPRVPGGLEVTPAAASPVRLQQQADIAAAQRVGVPVMTSDVFRPKTKAGQALQQTTEFAGTGEMRKTQQAARAEVAEKFLQDFGAGDVNEESLKVVQDLIATREAKLNDLVKKKTDVIKSVSAAGPVAMNEAENEIVRWVSELAKQPGNEFREATAFLEETFDKMRGQPIEVIEDMRKVVGNKLQSPEFRKVKDKVGKAFDSVYAAFNKDMAAHIKANAADPDAVSKWTKANRELAVLYGEFRKFKELQSALDLGDERISVISSIIKNQDPAVIKKLNDNLSPQGQANLRALVVSKVASEAGGIGSIEPNRFLTSVQKNAKQFGATFSKDDLDRLRDIQAAFKLTARADEAVKGAKTGIQTIPMIAAAIGGETFGAARAVLGGFALGKIASAIESPTVRDLLAKMPQVRRGSPQELELAKSIVMAIGQLPQAEQQQPSMQ